MFNLIVGARWVQYVYNIIDLIGISCQHVFGKKDDQIFHGRKLLFKSTTKIAPDPMTKITFTWMIPILT